MPNLVDIVELAEALGTKSVYIAADRCVVVRNRNATCRKCVEACPAHAITIGGNSVSIDAAACVGCGACTAICPTEALIPLAPLDEDLAASIATACAAADNTAAFACARIASKHRGDPDKYAEVPCLARMEESILLELAARGVGDIVLVDGTCATCKHRGCVPGIDATVASANALLAAQGSEIRIRRASEFPNNVLLEDTGALFGASRRGFFTQARSRAKDAASTAVEVTLKKNSEQPTLRERLKMSDTGTLPQFNAARRMNTLDALDAIGTPVIPEITTRLWGNVDIDYDACSACGMCTVFCPTGALVKSDLAPEDGEGSYLEFSVADCVQCNVCSDICLKKCLRVDKTVSTEELFDFEPRLIRIPEKRARAGILSSLKR